LEDVQLIEKDFLQPLSTYEVNVSFVCKSAIIKLKRVESSKIPVSVSQLDILYHEILTNLKDTFTRIQKTSQFKDFLQVYDVQKKQAVV